MIGTAILVALGLIGLAMALAFWRLLRGPDVVDRVIAIDTLYINACAMLLAYGMLGTTDLHFEAALIIAMLGFLSTAAFAKFLLRGDIIE
ncbi:MAG: cation:proton antiporter [Gammaproteobacteria bacterium SG8_30]|jgi:multicomponent K+:H+ antiporter subunit F|nr:MAG: cation:proton antiporter [Gammaproteobacteria bacterium SG8_30]